jgi:hypothetical protein
MSVISSLRENEEVVKELTAILQEFFSGRRTNFNPNVHLSKKALALYRFHTQK